MSQTQEATLRKSVALSSVILFSASALLLLLGVFGLREWAAQVAYGHAVQHLVIFSAGCVMGITLTKAYTSRKHL